MRLLPRLARVYGDWLTRTPASRGFALAGAGRMVAREMCGEPIAAVGAGLRRLALADDRHTRARADWRRGVFIPESRLRRGPK